jgi:pimeloyl-ACP methyl ester carboxylesterase
MASVSLSAGQIAYSDTGGSASPLVLMHGLAMDGRVWDDVVGRLDGTARIVRPTMPFGSHRAPMRADADLSLPGMCRLLAEFLDALDLRDATLVFNDWGGAQVMIAAGLMDRVARVALVACEAFENYPPGIAGRLASISARMPGGIELMRRTLAVRSLRRLPFTFGWMSKRGVPDELMESWLEPLASKAIRRDLAKYAGDTRRGRREMLAATPALRSFERPVLVVWASEDRLMPAAHGRRLADGFPHSRLVEVPDSYTLMPIDRPDALAAELQEFLTAR